MQKIENELSKPKKPTKRRAWLHVRRAVQRANILKTKPWLHATGPRTPEGRSIARMNAYKTGNFDAEMQGIRKWMSAQHAFVKAVLAHLARTYPVASRDERLKLPRQIRDSLT